MRSLKALGFEVGTFTLTQLLALFIGIRMLTFTPRDMVVVESTSSGVGLFVGALLVSTLILILLIKFLNVRLIFQLLFAWLIFVGSLTVFELTIGEPIAMTLAALLVILRFAKPIVLLQNLAIVLAIAGIAPQLAMLFGTPTILVVLVIISVYDYIAVFKTKHMVTMFQKLNAHNTPFALMIPDKGNLLQKITPPSSSKSKKGRDFFFLGTGDIAFPAIFAVAALADFGPTSAVLIIIGSVVGMLFDHYLLLKLEKPIPALPSIALFSILGFALSLLI